MFKIKRSAIHGKGVFASRNIKKDEILGFYGFRKTESQDEVDGPYGLDTSTDGSPGDVVFITCPFRYINHSRNENVIIYCDRSIRAIRDIAINEEITSYYGDKWDQLYSREAKTTA